MNSGSDRAAASTRTAGGGRGPAHGGAAPTGPGPWGEQAPSFKALWGRLDALRAEKGLSFQGLASRINKLDRGRRISRSTVHDRMVSGRRVGWPEVQLTVKALGQDEEQWKRLWRQADLAHRREPGAPRDAVGLPVVARGQLPADVGEFTGRERELERACQVLAPGTDGRGTAVSILAVGGMAGVGKTRFAVHVAYRLKHRFDELQLYLDLRGHSPGQEPTEPGPVLEAFLQLLGVPGGQVPRDLEARAALYRSLLDGRRAIVLLDNAAGEEQVRPLLPGSPTCGVIVTSRRALALDGVQPLTLDVFTPAEAAALLGRVVGGERVGAEPDAAAEIARLCGCLPLAVTLAARRLQARPTWTLAHFAGRLRAEERRLGELKASDRAVRPVFGVSYDHLPAASRRLFRLLGMHPGPDFTHESAAALAGIAPDEAESMLEGLLDEHLLQQITPGRYRFHDLLHVYAKERGLQDDAPAVREAAIGRVLAWYLHTADAADRVLAPHRRHACPEAPHDARDARTFATHEQALAWCDAEHANLVAATHQAAEHGHHAIAWQFAIAMYSFFNLRKHWDDWIATHRTALASARRLDDPAAEAWVLIGLGIAYAEVRRLDEAVDCFERALVIRRWLGDRRGEAEVLNNLGEACRRRGQFERAIRYYQLDLAVCDEIGDRRGQSISLNNSGKAYHELGRLTDALHCHRQALAACREVGDRYSEGEILNDLGETYQALGDLGAAVAHFEHALAIRSELGDRLGTAHTHAHLGNTAHDADDQRQAVVHWRQALATLSQLNDPGAAELRAKLRGL